MYIRTLFFSLWGWSRREEGARGNCLEQGWEAWLDGGNGAWADRSALRLRVGVLLTVVPYLIHAHAHSCGVMPKADAAPC